MTDPILVRDAREDDTARITELYAVHVLHGLATFEEIPPGVEEMERRLYEVKTGQRPYLVAEAGGRVLGYAYAGPYRTRPAYRYTLENSIYLDAAVSRRGIGTMLLAALIARCEAGPWRQMVAIIGDRENHASIGLHRKLGFRHVGTLENVGFKHGRWVDSVVMQRQLGGER